jgi:exonuclease III
MKGTAFVVREGIRLDHVEKLPSGRAIAAVFQGILLVNLSAPSGTSRKAEREAFYNMVLPSLLRNEVSQVILGGDFTCVMDPCDVTGPYTRCKALEAIIHDMPLRTLGGKTCKVRFSHTTMQQEHRGSIDYIFRPDLWS